MNTSKFIKALLAVFILLITVLAPPNYVPIPYTHQGIAEAANMEPRALPDKYIQRMANVHEEYGIPQKLYKSSGSVTVEKTFLDKIFNGNTYRQIWGEGLPYQLESKDGSQKYPGYCAHSWGNVPPDLTAVGYVKDPRVLKLTNAIANDHPESPSEAQAIITQLMLWGGINWDFAKDMFSSGKLSNNASDYQTQTMAGHAQKAWTNWEYISDTSVKEIHPLEPSSLNAKTLCHPMKEVNEQVAIIEFQTVAGGKNFGDLKSIADVTATNMPTGAEIFYGTSTGITEKLNLYNEKPKKNAVYIFSTKQAQEYKPLVQITYKGHWEVLNHQVLVVYETNGGSKARYQPFLLPRIPKLKWNINVAPCPTTPCETACCDIPCPDDPDEPEPVPPESSEATIPLRWYNLPGAFGEIKNGVGFKNNANTQTGKFATSRNREHFEAMNGIPSSERLYVNLGGTEGIIDVEYDFVTIKQDFQIMWSSSAYDCHPRTHGCTSHNSSASFTDTFKWEFKVMDLKSATFRVLKDGKVEQPELDINVDIIDSASTPGSFKLNVGDTGGTTSKANLTAGPGTDANFSIHNIGATNQWKTSHTYSGNTHKSQHDTKKLDFKSVAYAQGNQAIGDIFAQNDSLSITIRDKEYVIIPKQNRKTSKPFVTDRGSGHDDTQTTGSTGTSFSTTITGNDLILDATNENGAFGLGVGMEYFKPRSEKWDVWSHIPVRGYTGNPEDGLARNSKGSSQDVTPSIPDNSNSTLPQSHTPLLAEDLPMNVHAVNGIYEFQTEEESNLLNYDTEGYVTTIVGDQRDVNENVDNLSDGTKRGSSTQYKNVKNPVDEDHYMDGNKARIQYTNWQVPVSSGEHGLTFKHSTKQPDNNKSSELNSIPTYRSLNPILVHNPTTTQFAWIHDTSIAQLQDQRIAAGNDRISVHDSVKSESDNARQYIDFDFQLSIPNNTTFKKYWGQTSGTSTSVGQTDLDFTEPGTLGKIFDNTTNIKTYDDRLMRNPYLTEGGQYSTNNTNMETVHPLTTKNAWDVSKWTNAKYVKFPYDVYYYKNSNEDGGSPAGSYEAGTWIKLYDDNRTLKSNDTEYFNFHLESHQKDIKDGVVYVLSETINTPQDLVNKPDELYASSEQYTNGTRQPEGIEQGAILTENDAQATHTTSNQFNVDAIGRIGNLLVSDANDPAWKDVFWKVNYNGNIDTTSPVAKDYSLNYNIYESALLPNKTGFPAFNRYRTIHQWHGGTEPKYTLPIRTNPVSKGQSKQTIKIGYSIGGSIQTIGDYDYKMWIYPQNQLAGDYKTGKPNDNFKLITTDAYSSGAKYREYYDSKVNNTLHGQSGVLGKSYTPAYVHNISSSLADPRMKMGQWEKSNKTYKTALAKGQASKVIIGTPSWIEIPRELRTQIGSNETKGRWGWGKTDPTETGTALTTPYNEFKTSIINGNNITGSKGGGGSGNMGAKLTDGSCNCGEAYSNIQKWNFNYGLPQNTFVWFNQKVDASGLPVLEKPNKDQYIITSMTLRTKTNRKSFEGESDAWQQEIVQPAITNGSQYKASNSQSIPDWDLTMFTNHGVNSVPKITQIASEDPTIGNKYPPTSTGNITAQGTDPTGGVVTTPNKWDPAQAGDISKPSLDIVWWNYSKQSTTDKDNIGTH